jgi:hypothetical protein
MSFRQLEISLSPYSSDLNNTAMISGKVFHSKRKL